MQQQELLRDFISEEQLAAELGKVRRTVQRWRQIRFGPPHLKIGKRVMYSKDSVLRWLHSLEQGATRQRRAGQSRD